MDDGGPSGPDSLKDGRDGPADNAQPYQQEDVLLTKAAIRGDADAMQRVWERNARWVAAIILAHKPRRADLEDLLQDVALTFVRRASEVRDPAALRPWLRTVAINAARAAGRGVTTARRHGEGIRLVREATQQQRAEAEPAERVEGGAERSRVLDLALNLPEAYREPLLLRTTRGMSYRQIAAVTGLPETTIETRIARGRRMLRELARAAGGRTTDGPKTQRKTDSDSKPDSTEDDPARPAGHIAGRTSGERGAK